MEAEEEVVVVLRPDDRRTKHVRKVLKAAEGARVRAGVLDGGTTDKATVRWIDSDDSNVGSSLRLYLGRAATMMRPPEPHTRPRLDLLLSMPRPLQFARLLPMISSLGVGTLWITGGERHAGTPGALSACVTP